MAGVLDRGELVTQRLRARFGRKRRDQLGELRGIRFQPLRDSSTSTRIMDGSSRAPAPILSAEQLPPRSSQLSRTTASVAYQSTGSSRLTITLLVVVYSR